MAADQDVPAIGAERGRADPLREVGQPASAKGRSVPELEETILERMLVTPGLLVLLGVSRYVQDFLGAPAITAGNTYGLPDNYWTEIGDQLVIDFVAPAKKNPICPPW